MSKISQHLADPTFLRKFHGWATLSWLAASIPICIFFGNSVFVVVFISVYANVVGHWSSWQAARVEEKQKAQEDQEQEKQDRLVNRINEITPDKD